jgi:opacity protein-like surface antigen
MPKLRRIIVTALAASALTVATATSAQAATIDDYTNTADVCGSVGFSRYGDVFRFLDICRDGRGVRVQATNPTTGVPSTSDAKWHHDYTGGYTGYDWDNAGVYNTDIDEDACFYFRAGLVDNGDFVDNSYGIWRLACASN